MRKLREIAGYVLGGLVFVLLIPVLMWLVSGRPVFWTAPIWRMVVALLLALVGLSLSVWSIVYMRLVGRGNPMDAFNQEVAPRTSQLMTDGPYAICRNPMLLGVLLYYLGFVILLASVKAALVLVVDPHRSHPFFRIHGPSSPFFPDPTVP